MASGSGTPPSIHWYRRGPAIRAASVCICLLSTMSLLSASHTRSASSLVRFASGRTTSLADVRSLPLEDFPIRTVTSGSRRPFPSSFDPATPSRSMCPCNSGASCRNRPSTPSSSIHCSWKGNAHFNLSSAKSANRPLQRSNRIDAAKENTQRVPLSVQLFFNKTKARDTC